MYLTSYPIAIQCFLKAFIPDCVAFVSSTILWTIYSWPLKTNSCAVHTPNRAVNPVETHEVPISEMKGVVRNKKIFTSCKFSLYFALSVFKVLCIAKYDIKIQSAKFFHQICWMCLNCFPGRVVLL